MRLHERCAKGGSFLGELDQPQAMLILARKDLRAAIILTAHDDADTEIVGFHTQQAKMLIEHVEGLLQTKKERKEPQQGL